MSGHSIDCIEMMVNIKLEDENTCDLLYDALVLESSYNPNERAQANLEKDKDLLILKISAKDSISARASINSFMKWINLSLEIISLSKNEEKL